MDLGFRGYGSEVIDGEEDLVAVDGMRKGPWTDEEDSTLFQYVSLHGEGRWNSVAVNTGLKRTGKSCRLRWLNYLRPDLRRGNITLEEQLLILELHSRWGNRWSKIAKHIPGRTDNEIKNYWRTRVQKQAKHLKCDVNSQQFRDMVHGVFIPRLMEKIRASKADSAEYSDPDDITKIQTSCNELTCESSWNSQVSPISSLTECAYSSTGYEYSEDNHNTLAEQGNWPEFEARPPGLSQRGWDEGGRFTGVQEWNEESLRMLRRHLLEEDF
ncbi:hypothetical protein MLD38_021684 [Melastoma candidum]|uniref:Uncharacterized protein n=1 Tax=Melastoma candidum TaxID=119954 RepID=A0ACB9QK91_9MYRT|nr:hypothetical protein MLD38_021684 [Melastoma candidum]